MDRGQVERILLRAERNGTPIELARVRAVAGKGLTGDRYFEREDDGVNGRDLTLIEAEALEGLLADTGIDLDSAQTGRNVVTRGIALNDLVDRRFRVGEIECVGRRLCDPCDTLQRRTQPGVLRGLVNRGGLRADIVTDGEIAVGDEVAVI
jgi:MOSC domain-containing protein YiiM